MLLPSPWLPELRCGSEVEPRFTTVISYVLSDYLVALACNPTPGKVEVCHKASLSYTASFMPA